MENYSKPCHSYGKKYYFEPQNTQKAEFEVSKTAILVENWLTLIGMRQGTFHSLSFSDQTFTVAVWTPKKFFPLLTRPQGSQGCQKIRFFFLQMKMFSFCAKIAPRRHKLQKTIKIEEKMSINPCFLGLF